MSWVGVARCLRIASAPPGRLEREPVAMVTTRLQTSEKDELVSLRVWFSCLVMMSCDRHTGSVFPALPWGDVSSAQVGMIDSCSRNCVGIDQVGYV